MCLYIRAYINPRMPTALASASLLHLPFTCSKWALGVVMSPLRGGDTNGRIYEINAHVDAPSAASMVDRKWLEALSQGVSPSACCWPHVTQRLLMSLRDAALGRSSLGLGQKTSSWTGGVAGRSIQATESLITEQGRDNPVENCAAQTRHRSYSRMFCPLWAACKKRIDWNKMK